MSNKADIPPPSQQQLWAQRGCLSVFQKKKRLCFATPFFSKRGVLMGVFIKMILSHISLPNTIKLCKPEPALPSSQKLLRIP